jgi:hypothetical protein
VSSSTQHPLKPSKGDSSGLVDADGHPFASPRISTPRFFALLCPMLVRLQLWNMRTLISAGHFAAICNLYSLQELFIEEAADDGEVCFDKPIWLSWKLRTLVIMITMSLLELLLLVFANSIWRCLRRRIKSPPVSLILLN